MFKCLGLIPKEKEKKKHGSLDPSIGAKQHTVGSVIPSINATECTVCGRYVLASRPCTWTRETNFFLRLIHHVNACRSACLIQADIHIKLKSILGRKRAHKRQ
jgi:hypothetical protein